VAEPDNLELRTFSDIATDLISRWGDALNKEEEWFGKRPRTLEEAIKRSALSQIPSGKSGRTKRHSHQTRLPHHVLAEASQHLLARQQEISVCASFDELFNVVEGTVLQIPGAGEMLVYDIAQRLGVFLKLEPDKVYMHRGTRKGAKSLGLTSEAKAIPLDEFPLALSELGAFRLEDVLCIYRMALARIRSGSGGPRPKSRC
jgi:hypothetical protein